MSTIFAPITQIGHAGVSIIRISGEETKECLKKLGFRGIPQHQKVCLQKIFDTDNNALLDEVLISFFKSPKSFTGEDVAEISIHSSPFILKKIFEILSRLPNVRFAEAGEFSKRAFLNGKLDLVQAEAIPDLIAAETAMQHRQALRQLSGELGKIYENWRERLIEISAKVAASIDFPEDDLPENLIEKIESEIKILVSEIEMHLGDQKIGQKIKDGFSLAIVGAPNVGKSSLINFLAQSEVAIVSEIAGTTRDVIETHLSIAGLPVKISDTAGLRETTDKIEQEGIRRALEKAASADLKIFIIDATNPVFRDELIDENTLILINKIDLEKREILPVFYKNYDHVKVSLTNKINSSQFIKKLEEKFLKIFLKNKNPLDLPLITQERYRAALIKTSENLKNFSLKKNIEIAAEDLRIAAFELGKITGKVGIENILEVIFSRFCIGK